MTTVHGALSSVAASPRSPYPSRPRHCSPGPSAPASPASPSSSRPPAYVARRPSPPPPRPREQGWRDSGERVLACQAMDPSQSAGRSVLTTFKLVALCAAAQVVGTFGILIAAGLDFTRPKTLWIAGPLTVGPADTGLGPAVGSTVRPLPFGPGAEDLRRIATGALRTLILLRLALAEAAALFVLLSAQLAHR